MPSTYLIRSGSMHEAKPAKPKPPMPRYIDLETPQPFDIRVAIDAAHGYGADIDPIWAVVKAGDTPMRVIKALLAQSGYSNPVVSPPQGATSFRFDAKDGYPVFMRVDKHVIKVDVRLANGRKIKPTV